VTRHHRQRPVYRIDDTGACTVDTHHPTKEQVLALMRRLGMNDRLDEARRILPDTLDMDRDGPLLDQLGLSLDEAVNRLGGSAW
jgi:hypothetical protein